MPLPRYKVESALADLGLSAAPVMSGTFGNSNVNGTVQMPIAITGAGGLVAVSGGNALAVKKAGYFLLQTEGGAGYNAGSSNFYTAWTIDLRRNNVSFHSHAAWAGNDGGGGNNNNNACAYLTPLCVPGDLLTIFCTGSNLVGCGGTWTLWFVPTAYYLG